MENTLDTQMEGFKEWMNLNENKDQPVFIDQKCDEIAGLCKMINQCCAKAKRIKGSEMFPKGGGQSLESISKQLAAIEKKINAMVAG
jgi:hypothetical protein